MGFFSNKHVYLDWASSAPVSPGAVRAFAHALSVSGNPSSPHTAGVAARALLEGARCTVARLTEAKTEGVIFTSGATEANNLAIQGLIKELRSRNIQPDQMHVLYMPGSHSSVIGSVAAVARQGVTTEELHIKDGAVDVAQLKEQLRPTTRLVIMDAVCGETGTRYDTRSIRTALDAYAKAQGIDRILLHVDASQAPLITPFDLTRLSADMAALDAQKIGGVRGAGALIRRSHVKLAPLLLGGGQERGLRPGTEPVALITAFAAALSEANREQHAFETRARAYRTECIALLTRTFPDLLVNAGKEYAPHILNLSFPGRDTDYAVMLLDAAGFAVATKSACETDGEEGSRAVRALFKDEDRARSTLRISWGPSTRRRDLRRFAEALNRTIRFLDTA